MRRHRRRRPGRRGRDTARRPRRGCTRRRDAVADGAPPPTPPGAPAAAGGGDSGAYTVRLRSLEKNVNELKEQIFRTKARLNLLKETVLGGVIGASRAVIHHKNEMGSSFRLIKAAFALDGVQIAAKSEGGLADMQEFGRLQRRDPARIAHAVGRAAVPGQRLRRFSYLKGYKFNVKSSHTFVAGRIEDHQHQRRSLREGEHHRPCCSGQAAIDFRVNVMSPARAGGSGGGEEVKTFMANRAGSRQHLRSRDGTRRGWCGPSTSTTRVKKLMHLEVRNVPRDGLRAASRRQPPPPEHRRRFACWKRSAVTPSRTTMKRRPSC
jgi:hypothetical protein